MGPISSLSDLLAALLRQAWLIVVILAVGLPAVYAYALSRPQAYEAAGVVSVEGPQALESGVNLSRQLDEIQQALMARDNLATHVNALNLFPDLASQNERIAVTRASITITRLIDPAQAWQPTAQPYGLSIMVRLGDPDLAAQLANALINSIVTEDARRVRLRALTTRDRTTATLAFLDDEEERLQDAIEGVESSIADYRVSNLASLPENLAGARDQRANLISQRLALNRELIEAEAAQGLRNLTPSRDQPLQAQLTILSEAIAEAEATLAAAPGVERELGALTRRLTTLEAELEAVLAQRTEASMNQYLANQVRPDHFTVLETAVPPEYSVSANRRKIAMAGGVAVTALAFGLALARELLNPVLRTVAQMRRELGIEPVVVVPRVVSSATARRRHGLGALFVASLLGAIAAATAVAGAPSTQPAEVAPAADVAGGPPGPAA